MAAVTLPIQLSAKMIPAGEAASADATVPDASGQGGVPLFFAALLAQQLGAAGHAKANGVMEVVDTKADSGSDATSADAAVGGIVDTLAQIQQGVPGLPVPPVMNAVPPEMPAEESVGVTPSGQSVSMAHGVGIGLEVAEAATAGRQSVAASAAAFAETADRPAAVFTVPAEALAEQARPVAAGVQQPAPSTQVTTGAIPQPVSSPAWGDALGDRMVWMVNQQQQGAELRLNPPSLGPLEIKLSMSGDGQASLTFSTQHLPVKEALEAATPRLREMFGESGLNLGSVSVNVGSFSQQQGGEQQQASRQAPQEWGQAQQETDFTSLLPTAVTSLGRNGNGMVDFFA